MYRKFCLYISFFFLPLALPGQTGFHLPDNERKDRIPFRLIGNVPIVKTKINGKTLFLILDTGSTTTILFDSNHIDSLYLQNISKIYIRGLGTKEKLEGVKSTGNIVKIGQVVDTSHTLYAILNHSFNFSKRLGVEIDGILGNDFFAHSIVKINYNAETISVYNPSHYSLRNCWWCEDVPLFFMSNRPYISVQVDMGKTKRKVNLLIDTGSSDALWLFDSQGYLQRNPHYFFDDLLGLGLNGAVFGKRSRIPGISIKSYSLSNVNISFPEGKITRLVNFNENNDGLLGGSILKRFTVILDFKNKRIRFKKNHHYNDPFRYNMSGLILAEKEKALIKTKEIQHTNLAPSIVIKNKEYLYTSHTQDEAKPHYKLVPVYNVVYVRKGSVAQKAGIKKGDVVLAVNGDPSYHYKLYELMLLFSKKEGKEISLKIGRNGVVKKVSFRLEKILQKE